MRYIAVAVVLHWAIAAAILGNLLLGWWMEGAIEGVDTQRRAITAFQLHKSLGLTILALSIVRLAWRLLHPPPPLPESVRGWQRRAAVATHWLFYALMLGIPLTGWLMVSAQWRDGAALNVPTVWFGRFEVPHLFGLHEAPDRVRSAVADNAGETHEWLAWAAFWLLVLHLGAALKHHFVDRDRVLASMLPSFSRGEWVRAAVFAGGTALVVGAGLAICLALFRVPLGSVAFKVEDTPYPPTAAAAVAPSRGEWRFSPGRGELRFSGVHAGSPFEGSFSRWQATLVFDPDDLPGSSFEAEIDMPLPATAIPSTTRRFRRPNGSTCSATRWRATAARGSRHPGRRGSRSPAS